MCNASNHPPDCTCGFGGQYYGSDSSAEGGTAAHNAIRSAYIAHFTRIRERGEMAPNAHCPVCGETVFFYESPYGGRVYFDDVGDPWPKHPCTDRPYAPGGGESTSSPDIADLMRIMQTRALMHEPKIKRGHKSLIASITWQCEDKQSARVFFRMASEEHMKHLMRHLRTASFTTTDGSAVRRAQQVQEQTVIGLHLSFTDPVAKAWLGADGIATPHGQHAALIAPLSVQYLGNTTLNPNLF